MYALGLGPHNSLISSLHLIVFFCDSLNLLKRVFFDMGWLLHLSRKGGLCTIASFITVRNGSKRKGWSKKRKRNYISHLYFSYQQFHKTIWHAWTHAKTKINNFLAILAVAETRPCTVRQALWDWVCLKNNHFYKEEYFNIFSSGLTMLPLRTKRHQTKSQHQAWDHRFSCWSELSKRLPKYYRLLLLPLVTLRNGS